MIKLIFAEEISKQSIDGVACFLLNGYSKIWKERDELKKELLSETEPELEDLENSQHIHIAENKKACSEEHTKCVLEQPFDKEIMGATHGLNQPFQQKPEIEMGLYQQTHCQLELKGTEKNETK